MHVKRAQYVDKALSGEVMSISSCKRDREANEAYELTFTDKDMYGVDAPHNNGLVLTVNINTFDVIDSRSSSEIMYHSLYKKLDLPASQVRSANMQVFIFTGKVV